MSVKLIIANGTNGRGALNKAFGQNETIVQVLNLQSIDTYSIDAHVDGVSGFYYKPASTGRIYQLDTSDLSAQLLLFVIETDS